MSKVLARRVNAVVATETVACDVTVVEYCWLPCASLVTIVTAVTRDNMVGGLARGPDTVVAGYAVSGYRRMIHE